MEVHLISLSDVCLISLPTFLTFPLFSLFLPFFHLLRDLYLALLSGLRPDLPALSYTGKFITLLDEGHFRSRL